LKSQTPAWNDITDVTYKKTLGFQERPVAKKSSQV